jgi:hypothetical protein
MLRSVDFAHLVQLEDVRLGTKRNVPIRASDKHGLTAYSCHSPSRWPSCTHSSSMALSHVLRHEASLNTVIRRRRRPLPTLSPRPHHHRRKHRQASTLVTTHCFVLSLFQSKLQIEPCLQILIKKSERSF